MAINPDQAATHTRIAEVNLRQAAADYRAGRITRDQLNEAIAATHHTRRAEEWATRQNAR